MDRRKTTMLTIIIGGGLFATWRIYGLLNKSSPAPASAGLAQPAEPFSPDATTANATIGREEDLTAIRNAQLLVEAQPWGRDPFDPSPFEVEHVEAPILPVEKPAAKPPPAPTVTFTGVSRVDDRWLAAMGGAIVEVGDVIHDRYRVARISKSSVTLTSEGWAFCFQLGAKTPDVRPCDQSGRDGTPPDKGTEKP
jgi:hypothetical protein